MDTQRIITVFRTFVNKGVSFLAEFMYNSAYYFKAGVGFYEKAENLLCDARQPAGHPG